MTQAAGHIRPYSIKKQTQSLRPASTTRRGSSGYYVTSDGIGAIPRPAGISRAAFGLVVKGTCLHPMVRDGQVLIVQDGTPKPGELAVFWANGFDLPQVKIFQQRIRGVCIVVQQTTPRREIRIKLTDLRCLMRVAAIVEAPR
jgi:hypothetical protein